MQQEGYAVKSFLHLKDQRLGKKEIAKLYDQTGTIVDNTDSVLKQMHNFYQELYDSEESSSSEGKQQFRMNLSLPCVSEHLIFSDEITADEVLDVIKQLNKGKSPGPDGFSPDFYHKFAPFLTDLLARTFNEIFQRKRLPYSLAQAIIILFYKEADPLDLTNYQPILLTNFDYKILAYELAKRMQPTFLDCIHPSQMAYLKGKFIGTNIRKVQDAMDFINANPDGRLTILFLDFRKAFDTVSHEFLLILLRTMGYPLSLVSWIELIYSKSFAMVQHKGWLTKEFRVNRGVHQGCPLSCHLFNLVSQIIVHYLQKEGLFAQPLQENSNDASSMYTDDIALLIRKADLSKVLNILSYCGTFTGLHLNLSKTVPFDPHEKPYLTHGISVMDQPVKYLGAFLGISDQVEQKNFEMRKAKM